MDVNNFDQLTENDYQLSVLYKLLNYHNKYSKEQKDKALEIFSDITTNQLFDRILNGTKTIVQHYDETNNKSTKTVTTKFATPKELISIIQTKFGTRQKALEAIANHLTDNSDNLFVEFNDNPDSTVIEGEVDVVENGEQLEENVVNENQQQQSPDLFSDFN